MLSALYVISIGDARPFMLSSSVIGVSEASGPLSVAGVSRGVILLKTEHTATFFGHT